MGSCESLLLHVANAEHTSDPSEVAFLPLFAVNKQSTSRPFLFG